MSNFNRFLERIGLQPGINSSETSTRLPSRNDSISQNNLAAFRTITTMLAEIERSTPVEIGDNLPGLEDTEKRQMLKLSDAFSQLAVGQHEIVAVTTSIANNVLKVLITQNYARDDKDSFSTTHLQIMSPSEPDDLIQGQSTFDYMKKYTTNSDDFW